MDYQTNISKEYYVENYAKHAGLVYKKVINVESQPANYDANYLANFFKTPIMQRVTSGVQFTYMYNSSGNE